MSEFLYSWSNFVNGSEPLEATFQRLAESGYEGIEIIGEPARYSTDEVRELISRYGIKVSSIGSIFTGERDFSSADPAIRDRALEYVRDIARMASEVEAPLAILAPASCMRTLSLTPFEQERTWALEGMAEAAEYAGSLGIKLAIEAWNRYETHFLNRLEQAVDIARLLAMRNVGVMADVFHMNLEEGSIPDAIRAAGSMLMHIHLADSNRSVPGSGHLDFGPILSAAREAGYAGYLTFELIPAAADPLAVLESGRAEEFRTSFAQEAITYLKTVERAL